MSQQINGHGNDAKATAASKQVVEKGEALAQQSFFRSKLLRLQGIRGKFVSLRTIAQDLTSFSKRLDHSGYWWVTPMSF